MRIHVRHTETGHYLKTKDVWTERPEEAFDFQSPVRAIDFCLEQRIQKARLAYRFSNASFDFEVGPFS